MRHLKRKFLLVFILLLFSSFILVSLYNNPIIENDIILDNNEIYPEEASNKFYFHGVPYDWADKSDLGITIIDLESKSPILLRSFETDGYFFNDLRDNCLKIFNDLSFPIQYERMGIDIGGQEYMNNIFSSNTARNELFNFAIRNFKRIENNYPNTWKQNMVNKIDECFLFTKTYNSKRNYYINLSKMKWCGENPHGQMLSGGNGFAYKIGYFESFIFRRIEYNKIPIQEINSYLMILKSTLLESMNDKSPTNFKNININNGDIILSDLIVNGKGVTIKVWNNNSKKELIFNSFSHIKCLNEGGINYYLVYQNGKCTLINTQLEILNKTNIKKSIDRDAILETYLPLGEVKTIDSDENTLSSNRIYMKKKNGVYYIPTQVNGIPMEFIFDTGASDVSISLTEALFLYKNGKLSKSDILGKQYFSDATGKISVGTKIILRQIKIGNKIIQNIEASIVNNTNAPLLIGQSALEKLGKITFDTKSKILSFE